MKIGKIISTFARELLLLLAAVIVGGCILANTFLQGPKVVVYLDKDAKSPALLPAPTDKVLAGDRAALWWTVFNKSLQSTSAYDAKNYANDAVETVYGKAKP